MSSAGLQAGCRADLQIRTSLPEPTTPLPHSILLQTFTCKTNPVWKKIELEAFLPKD
jgi:hypothetical protein